MSEKLSTEHFHVAEMVSPLVIALLLSKNKTLSDEYLSETISDVVEESYNMIKIISDDLDEYVDSEKIKMSFTKFNLSVSANLLMLGEDINLKSSSDLLFKFLKSDIIDNIDIFSESVDDLTAVFIESFAHLVPIFLSFHSDLYFSDDLTLKQASELNDKVALNYISYVFSSLRFVKKHLIAGKDLDSLSIYIESIKISGKIYSVGLKSLFESLLQNDTLVKKYSVQHQSFLDKVYDMSTNAFLTVFKHSLSASHQIK